jgi:hypothetical protein
MKRNAVLLLVSASIGGVAALFACINEHARPVVDGGMITTSIPCVSAGAGGFPNPMCDPSDNSCPNGPGSTCPTCGQCPYASQCGNPSTCLAMGDNTTKPAWDFRLRRLWITDPPNLTSGVIEGSTGVITKGIDLAQTQCGDQGTGAFNWLLRVDQAGSTLTTGGAPPTGDPFNTGYCFYNHVLVGADGGGNHDITPAQVSLTFDDAGAFTTAPIALLNVPVFLSPDGGAGDPGNVIILPLRNAVLKQASVSNDNNCIGSYNAIAVADGGGPQGEACYVNDPSSCSKWHTAGTLGAVMTLEDADSVPLSILPVTLCVLLTGTQADPVTHGCMRDTNNNIIAQGDYCSTTNMPGGCADSFWLAATFAASAVTINDGSLEPTCQGAGDAGTDASDAGGDASDAASD